MLALYVGNLIIIEHNIVRPINCVRLFISLSRSLCLYFAHEHLHTERFQSVRRHNFEASCTVKREWHGFLTESV